MTNAERPEFTSRIEYTGDFRKLMSQVCEGYSIGNYLSHKVVTMGYEDLNVILNTDQNKYFAKLFSSSRSLSDCERYVGIIKKALDAGVSHPALYESPQGLLYQTPEGDDNLKVRLCLMEYIDGKTFYELGEKPTREEGEVLIEEAAKINRVNHRPALVYDSWAINNLVAEFEGKKDILEDADRDAIAPLAQEFGAIQLQDLPHSLIHGDLLGTNVMKDKQGKLHIIDFSVSNWAPRIGELSFLLCDLFFDPENPNRYIDRLRWVVAQYQRHIQLTPRELEVLPLFIKAAHAMLIIGAGYEKSQGNTREENEHWLAQGRKGLAISQRSLS